jgi:uncharacterized protein YbjT (DUF2867 family)
MILVTGATSNAGAAVVRALLADGQQVRALVRDPERVRLPEGAEAAAGDLNRPETLAPHLDGVTAVFPLSGPESLLPAERVAILAEVLERALRFEGQSDQEARAQMLGSMPPEYVDAMFRFFADGEVDESRVLPTVEAVTGRPPGTFEQWARSHAAAFRPAPERKER